MGNVIKLDGFSISNDFTTDYRGKGKFAEEDFISYFNSNPKNKTKTLIDVRENIDFQKIDVDFVIDNNGTSNDITIDDVLGDRKRFVKIEVKYNGPALKTNKIAFELISHSKLGWGAFSECDYMYVVFGEETENNLYVVKKRGIIDFKKWKEFIQDKKNKREIYENQKENIICNIMTYLDDMEKEKVIIFI